MLGFLFVVIAIAIEIVIEIVIDSEPNGDFDNDYDFDCDGDISDRHVEMGFKPVSTVVIVRYLTLKDRAFSSQLSALS